MLKIIAILLLIQAIHNLISTIKGVDINTIHQYAINEYPQIPEKTLRTICTLSIYIAGALSGIVNGLFIYASYYLFFLC
jgi:hypothetical protein